jgi:protein O-mannosyl-transferase
MRARLLLLAGALIAFGASLGSGFHLDDYAIFSEPVPSAAKTWTQRPLTDLTFWLNRQLGGGDALGYHLLNLALHLGAVVLAWECLRRLLPERAALIAAALFAIHPIQTEAVDYISARGIVLAALFCFAALWCWLEGRHWIAVAWFAAALLANEESAAFPLFLAWIEWCGITPKLARRSAPIVAMLVLAVAGGARIIYAAAVAPGFFAQGHVILRYLRLVIVPYGFTIDPEISTAAWLSVAGWVVLIAAAFLAIRRAPSAVATWFIGGLLLLLPGSSLVPAADRRMYLPMFAFAAALGLALDRIRPVPVLAAIGVLVVGLSVQRSVVWMSDQSLWTEAVERAPDKIRPKLQLARTLPAAPALELLNRARIGAPHDPAIAAETGRILLSEGQPEGALDEFGRALALDPTNPQYLNNRGAALRALGQTEAARADFVRALQLDSDFTEARENLAKLPPHLE